MSTETTHTHHLLVLSAAGNSELETATNELVARLKTGPGLDDVAADLARREPFAHRRALVCHSVDDAVAALEADDSKRIKSAVATGGAPPVAFMCSGQGAQYPGMGRGLYDHEPTFRRHLDRCCDTLEPHLGLDLRTLLFPDPDAAETAAATLEQTQNTQPALFVIEYANARLWMSWGVTPAAMIGHSIGEYAAACLAGVLSLDAALALVATRGRLMQDLPPGDMLTVPLDEADLEQHLGGAEGDGVSVATINAPGRSVVSGPAEAIEAFRQKLAAERVRARLLHTSHAFHSAMMEPILEPFTAEVAKVDLQPPRIPYVSNVTGTWITDAEATDPSYYATHLRRAVRFADGAGTLLDEPRRVLLEVGPGNTLVSLASRHPGKGDGHRMVASIRHPRSKDDDLAVTLGAVAELWLAGVEVAWAGFYA